MVRPLTERTEPTRVLEVGPGTGAVTKHIVRHLKPDDHFDLVEINDQFAELLCRRFADDPTFQPAANRSAVHHVPLQEFRPAEPFDVIISGLPFNNFPAALVEELIDHMPIAAGAGRRTGVLRVHVRPSGAVPDLSPKDA